MKKTISIFLLMCFSLSLMGMASAETGSNEATIKGQILAYTEDYVEIQLRGRIALYGRY